MGRSWQLPTPLPQSPPAPLHRRTPLPAAAQPGRPSERDTPRDRGAAQLKTPPLTPRGTGCRSPFPLAEDSEPPTRCVPQFPLSPPRSASEHRGCSGRRSASPPAPGHRSPPSSCPSNIPVHSLPHPPSPPPRMSHGDPQLRPIPSIHRVRPPQHTPGSALFCCLLMGVTIYNFWREATTPPKKKNQCTNTGTACR